MPLRLSRRPLAGLHAGAALRRDYQAKTPARCSTASICMSRCRRCARRSHAAPPAEGSAEVASRIAAARAIQRERYAGQAAGNGAAAVRTNAEADGELLERVAAPDQDGRDLLAQAADRMKLSARGYHRVLRVARTLADLGGAPTVRRILSPKR